MGKIFILMASTLLTGCLMILDDDCDRRDPDYWYTEEDCYDTRQTVEVCDYQGCWTETRPVRVCDEYHVCKDRRAR
mgnify:CR=1 FL=1